MGAQNNQLKKNKIQFAVVREDSNVELSLIKQFNLKKPILIGSGGCTAFDITCKHPELPITLIEPNSYQINLIKKKMSALKSQRQLPQKFGLNSKTTTQKNLVECGNFESLFKQFREFLYEFILPKKTLRELLLADSKKDLPSLFSHPYWPVAFDLFFSNSLLQTMFGPAAIQHAPKNSYPSYFRGVIEKGLLRIDCKHNYFLHHIFLGHYIAGKKNTPLYLQNPPRQFDIKFINKMADQIDDYSKYDLVGLSNIFDWSSKKDVKSIGNKLAQELKPGAVVVYRQLNNANNFTPYFGKNITWLTKLAAALHKKDRSLFYQSLHIGVKK